MIRMRGCEGTEFLYAEASSHSEVWRKFTRRGLEGACDDLPRTAKSSRLGWSKNLELGQIEERLRLWRILASCESTFDIW